MWPARSLPSKEHFVKTTFSPQFNYLQTCMLEMTQVISQRLLVNEKIPIVFIEEMRNEYMAAFNKWAAGQRAAYEVMAANIELSSPELLQGLRLENTLVFQSMVRMTGIVVMLLEYYELEEASPRRAELKGRIDTEITAAKATVDSL